MAEDWGAAEEDIETRERGRVRGPLRVELGDGRDEVRSADCWGAAAE
ncbi:hypothetical protein LINGRAHAP2_LOCUS6449 [Linum grandiflorum]